MPRHHTVSAYAQVGQPSPQFMPPAPREAAPASASAYSHQQHRAASPTAGERSRSRAGSAHDRPLRPPSAHALQQAAEVYGAIPYGGGAFHAHSGGGGGSGNTSRPTTPAALGGGWMNDEVAAAAAAARPHSPTRSSSRASRARGAHARAASAGQFRSAQLQLMNANAPSALSAGVPTCYALLNAPTGAGGKRPSFPVPPPALPAATALSFSANSSPSGSSLQVLRSRGRPVSSASVLAASHHASTHAYGAAIPQASATHYAPPNSAATTVLNQTADQRRLALANWLHVFDMQRESLHRSIDIRPYLAKAQQRDQRWATQQEEQTWKANPAAMAAAAAMAAESMRPHSSMSMRPQPPSAHRPRSTTPGGAAPRSAQPSPPSHPITAAYRGSPRHHRPQSAAQPLSPHQLSELRGTQQFPFPGHRSAMPSPPLSASPAEPLIPYGYFALSAATPLTTQPPPKPAAAAALRMSPFEEKAQSHTSSSYGSHEGYGETNAQLPSLLKPRFAAAAPEDESEMQEEEEDEADRVIYHLHTSARPVEPPRASTTSGSSVHQRQPSAVKIPAPVVPRFVDPATAAVELASHPSSAAENSVEMQGIVFELNNPPHSRQQTAKQSQQAPPAPQPPPSSPKRVAMEEDDDDAPAAFNFLAPSPAAHHASPPSPSAAGRAPASPSAKAPAVVAAPARVAAPATVAAPAVVPATQRASSVVEPTKPVSTTTQPAAASPRQSAAAVVRSEETRPEPEPRSVPAATPAPAVVTAPAPATARSPSVTPAAAAVSPSTTPSPVFAPAAPVIAPAATAVEEPKTKSPVLQSTAPTAAPAPVAAAASALPEPSPVKPTPPVSARSSTSSSPVVMPAAAPASPRPEVAVAPTIAPARLVDSASPAVSAGSAGPSPVLAPLPSTPPKAERRAIVVAARNPPSVASSPASAAAPVMAATEPIPQPLDSLPHTAAATEQKPTAASPPAVIVVNSRAAASASKGADAPSSTQHPKGTEPASPSSLLGDSPAITPVAVAAPTSAAEKVEAPAPVVVKLVDEKRASSSSSSAGSPVVPSTITDTHPAPVITAVAAAPAALKPVVVLAPRTPSVVAAPSVAQDSAPAPVAATAVIAAAQKTSAAPAVEHQDVAPASLPAPASEKRVEPTSAVAVSPKLQARSATQAPQTQASAASTPSAAVAAPAQASAAPAVVAALAPAPIMVAPAKPPTTPVTATSAPVPSETKQPEAPKSMVIQVPPANVAPSQPATASTVAPVVVAAAPVQPKAENVNTKPGETKPAMTDAPVVVATSAPTPILALPTAEPTPLESKPSPSSTAAAPEAKTAVVVESAASGVAGGDAAAALEKSAAEPRVVVATAEKESKRPSEPIAASVDVPSVPVAEKPKEADPKPEPKAAAAAVVTPESKEPVAPILPAAATVAPVIAPAAPVAESKPAPAAVVVAEVPPAITLPLIPAPASPLCHVCALNTATLYCSDCHLDLCAAGHCAAEVHTAASFRSHGRVPIAGKEQAMAQRAMRGFPAALPPTPAGPLCQACTQTTATLFCHDCSADLCAEHHCDATMHAASKMGEHVRVPIANKHLPRPAPPAAVSAVVASTAVAAAVAPAVVAAPAVAPAVVPAPVKIAAPASAVALAPVQTVEAAKPATTAAVAAPLQPAAAPVAAARAPTVVVGPVLVKPAAVEAAPAVVSAPPPAVVSAPAAAPVAASSAPVAAAIDDPSKAVAAVAPAVVVAPKIVLAPKVLPAATAAAAASPLDSAAALAAVSSSDLAQLKSLLSAHSGIWAGGSMSEADLRSFIVAAGPGPLAFLAAQAPRLETHLREFGSAAEFCAWLQYARVAQGEPVCHWENPALQPVRDLLAHPSCRILQSSSEQAALLGGPVIDELVLAAEGVGDLIGHIERLHALHQSFASADALTAAIKQVCSMGFFLPHPLLNRIVDYVKQRPAGSDQPQSQLFAPLGYKVPELDPEALDALIAQLGDAPDEASRWSQPVETKVALLLQYLASFDASGAQFENWESLCAAILQAQEARWPTIAPMTAEQKTELMDLLGSDDFALFDDCAESLHITAAGLDALLAAAGAHGFPGLLHILRGLNGMARRAQGFDDLISIVAQVVEDGAYSARADRTAILDFLTDSKQCKLFLMSSSSAATLSESARQILRSTPPATFDALLLAVGGGGGAASVASILAHLHSLDAVGTRLENVEDILPALEYALDPQRGNGSFVGARESKEFVSFLCGGEASKLLPRALAKRAAVEAELRHLATTIDAVFVSASSTLLALKRAAESKPLGLFAARPVAANRGSGEFDESPRGQRDDDETESPAPETPLELILNTLEKMNDGPIVGAAASSSSSSAGPKYDSLPSLLQALQTKLGEIKAHTEAEEARKLVMLKRLMNK